MALVIAAKINARLAGERERGDAANLGAIVNAARIFTPGRFLRVAEQVRASDVVIVTDLTATHAAEK